MSADDGDPDEHTQSDSMWEDVEDGDEDVDEGGSQLSVD